MEDYSIFNNHRRDLIAAVILKDNFIICERITKWMQLALAAFTAQRRRPGN